MRFYSRTLNLLFGVSVALGTFAIVVLFVTDKDTLLSDCLNGSQSPDDIRTCDRLRYVTLGWIVFDWIVQLCESSLMSPVYPTSVS